VARLFDDASTQYLERSSCPIDGTPPYSIACWVHPDAAIWHAAFSLSDGAALGSKLVVRGDLAPPRVQYYSKTSYVQFDATIIGSWNHLCAVEYAADSRALFLNGGSKSTDSTNATNVGFNQVNIGVRDSYGYNRHFSGPIALAAVWTAALTDAEAAILAHGTPPYLVRPTALAAYWPLLRTDQDLVGGYDLTPYNTPTWAPHPPKIWYPVPASGLWLASAAGGTDALTAADITAAAPTLETPVLARIVNLAATDITAGTPTLGTPVLARITHLDPTDISAGTPTLEQPTLHECNVLTATDITAGTPTLDPPTITRIVNLTATDLTAAAPTLDQPTITRIVNLTATDISASTPTLEQPTIHSGGTEDHLTALDLLAAAPLFDSPIFFAYTTTPAARTTTPILATLSSAPAAAQRTSVPY